MLAYCPHLDALAGHVRTFAEMMTGRHGDRLDAWMALALAENLVQPGGGWPLLTPVVKLRRHAHMCVRFT